MTKEQIITIVKALKKGFITAGEIEQLQELTTADFSDDEVERWQELNAKMINEHERINLTLNDKRELLQALKSGEIGKTFKNHYEVEILSDDEKQFLIELSLKL